MLETAARSENALNRKLCMFAAMASAPQLFLNKATPRGGNAHNVKPETIQLLSEEADEYKPTLKIAESAEQGTGSQPLRCNYDRRNSGAGGHVEPFCYRAFPS